MNTVATAQRAPQKHLAAVRPSVLFLRGGLAFLFTALVLFWPASALMAITLLVGAYLFADGVFALFNHRSGWAIFEGLIGIAVGLITFFRPGITAAVLSMLVGVWALLI